MNICPNCQYRGAERLCPRDGFPMVDEARVRRPNAEADLVGKVFDNRYEVLSLLGSGGMGWVFKARHLAMQHLVALKVMRRELAEDLNAIKRFYQEARACSKLSHPHTIKVHDFGTAEDGHLYLAMEYLQGEPLNKVIARDGPLPPARACHLAAGICQSLDEAHDLGLVHRDLKPANIFVCELHRLKDWVKVLDFGIAKFVAGDEESETLTRSGLVLGTPKYFSPEQAAAQPLDRRSDLYALGVILFEMLTGKAPFNAASAGSLAALHLHEAPPPLPEVVAGRPIPPALRTLVAQLLEKQPAARPASAAEVEARLLSVMGAWPQPIGPVPPDATVAAPGATAEATPRVARIPANDRPADVGPSPGSEAPAGALHPAAPGSARTTAPADVPAAPAASPTLPLGEAARAAAAPRTAALPPRDIPAGASAPPRPGWAPARRRAAVLVALGVLTLGLLALVVLLAGTGPSEGPTAPSVDAAPVASAPHAQRAPETGSSDVAPSPYGATGASTAAAIDAQQAAVAVAPATAPAAPQDSAARQEAPPAAASAAVAPAEAHASAPNPLVVPSAPASFPVSVVSRPAGAMVSEGRTELGRTPLALSVQAGRRRTVILYLKGYLPESRVVSPADGPQIVVRLQAEAPATARKPKVAEPRQTPTAGPAAEPSDYQIPFPTAPTPAPAANGGYRVPFPGGN